MRAISLTLGVSLAAVFQIAAGCGGNQHPKPVASVKVSSESSGYPLSEAALLTMRDRQDTPAIRKHAWAIFTEITKPSSPGDVASAPVWDTWIDNEDLFSAGTTPPRPSHRTIEPSLEIIAALQTEITGKLIRGCKSQSCEAALKKAKGIFEDKQRRVGTETKFNDSAASHIRTEGMNDSRTLNARAATFVNLHTPSNERNIVPFPSSSIIVKATWRTVGPDDTQSFEVWDPPDPSRPNWHPRTIQVKLAKNNEPCNKPANDNEPYLSSCFYAVPDPNVADYWLLLFGLHVITKETSDWTWSTFWWQVDPDIGKFHEGRPDTEFQRDYWKHYVMDSTLSMQTPLEAALSNTMIFPSQRCVTQKSVTAKICFNPFIERTLPNGPVSNCMACHRMATYPALVPDARGVAQRGYLSPDAACFDSPTPVMKVDYIWKLSPIPPNSVFEDFLSKLQSQLNFKNVLANR